VGFREFDGTVKGVLRWTEDSPATGKHPRNDNCYDIGEGMINSGSTVE
jgi:hypothetical protein